MSKGEAIRLTAIVLRLLASQLKGVGWAVVVSVAVHGLLAWVLWVAPIAQWMAEERVADPVTFEILRPEPVERIEPVADALTEPQPPEPPEPVEPELEPEPEELPEPAPAAVNAERLPDPSTAEPSEAGEPEQEAGGGAVASTIEVPEVDVQPGERPPDPEEQRRGLAALIDPSAAARSSFTITGPGPSRPSGPAPRGSGRGDRGRSEEEIERSLAAGLRAEAMTKNHTTRTRPQLRRQADGSYAYAGHRFQATIRPDGEVEFEDRPPVETNGISASGSFDLTDAIMGSAGQDPYRAEREWFMRHTEELRHRLEAQHRSEVMATGLRRLRGRLARVWSTTNRSHEARKRRIFQIWDEMAEDDSGRQARSIVIAFVRETIPEGSEHAYTERELATLNGSRESRERFAPY